MIFLLIGVLIDKVKLSYSRFVLCSFHSVENHLFARIEKFEAINFVFSYLNCSAMVTVTTKADIAKNVDDNNIRCGIGKGAMCHFAYDNEKNVQVFQLKR